MEVSAWTLVACTCQHARFAELYALPSYDKCWQRLQRRYDWLDQRSGGGVKPVLYALDWRAISLMTQPFPCRMPSTRKIVLGDIAPYCKCVAVLSARM